MSSRIDYPFFRPLDLLLYAALLALPLLLLLHGGEDGPETLLVHSPAGESRIALGHDTLFAVEGLLGPLSIRIESGRAMIESSPCTGRQCVRRGWMGSAGDCAVCLPSGVWIRLESDGPAPDAVTY